MRRRLARASGVLVVAFSSACGPGVATAEPPSGTESPTRSASSQAASVSSDIVGYWHRAQTCEEMLAAFEAAGLADSHREWLQGNFFGGEPGPTSGDPCAGAEGPLELSHWFTAEGEFGSHDEHGDQVDDGDVVSVDADTLSFPSHAAEFGYDGEVLVNYVVTDGAATFDAALPESCERTCADAYAWALSAFASGPWEPGDVP
jgi:hypothetical protein